MKILIVGGSSMIARRIGRRLQIDHEVNYTSRRQGDEYFLDMFTGEMHLPRHVNFDSVIHCAASFESDTLQGAARNEQINSTGAFHVAELAVQIQCHSLINMSSIFTVRHPKNEYFGSYSLSKYHGDENLQWACERQGIDYISLLPTQIYDETGAFRKNQPLLHHILEQARKAEETVLFGSRDVLRNFLHVDDLAEIVALILDKKITGRYPCLSPWMHPLSEIAKLAYSAFGRPARIRFDRSKPDIPTVYFPTDHTLYDRIDYKPTITLADGFYRYRQYMMDQEL